MKTYSLLIVDDQLDWCQSLEREFGAIDTFSLAPVLHNGKEAIAYLSAHQPDIVLLDLVMPLYDGIHVICHIREQITGYHPLIYVLSSIGTEESRRIVQSLDVNYYSAKPISCAAVLENLLRILSEHKSDSHDRIAFSNSLSRAAQENPPPQSKVAFALPVEAFLYDLGAPLYRLSTKRTSAALVLCLENPNQLLSIRALYQHTATTSSASAAAVERNIHSTVLNLQKSKSALFVGLFPYGAMRLSNREFLHESVYALRQRLRVDPF